MLFQHSKKLSFDNPIDNPIDNPFKKRDIFSRIFSAVKFYIFQQILDINKALKHRSKAFGSIIWRSGRHISLNWFKWLLNPVYNGSNTVVNGRILHFDSSIRQSSKHQKPFILGLF